jgi:hypothetical protein
VSSDEQTVYPLDVRDITPASFHWPGEKSHDGGKTWTLEEDHHMRKRAGLIRRAPDIRVWSASWQQVERIMNRFRSFIVNTAILIAAILLAAEQSHDRTKSDAAFKQLTTLAGEWEAIQAVSLASTPSRND